MLIINNKYTDCRAPFRSLFYWGFFPGFRNKRLFQEALKIIFFISFSYHIALVYTQVDTKSIESILVLSLLIDWSFHLALRSCLSKENYYWWPVSNVCSWAGNEHNLCASVNQDNPSFTPCRNCGWNTVRCRDFLVQTLQALFSNCRHLRCSPFPMSVAFYFLSCCLRSVTASKALGSFQYYTSGRLGGEVMLLAQLADIPQLIRTMFPWDCMHIVWVIHFLRLLWQARYAWTKIWLFLARHIWLPW